MTEEKKSNRNKTIKVILIATAILILTAVAIFLCINHVNKIGEKNIIYYDYAKSIEPHKYGVVPGAAIINGVPSLELKNRLEKACVMYENKEIEAIIISDSSDNVIRSMSKYLESRDIPAGKIYRDHEGEDTYSTIARASEQFPDDTFYFYTQEQFANRAGYLMKSLDVNGQVVTADNLIYQDKIQKIIREELAKVKAFLNITLPFTSSYESVEESKFEKGYLEDDF